MKIKPFLCLAAVIFIFSCSIAIAGVSDEHLTEADRSFTYEGKPIHPFLIEEIATCMKPPHPPVVTTVDLLAAYHKNEYQHSAIQKRDDWWFAERREQYRDILLYESFGYRWLGKLANGTHVLEVGANGGGTGFYMDIMFIRFFKSKIYWEGKTEKQLLMSVVGIYSLGDRYEGNIKVYPDKIVIPASKGQYGGGAIAEDTTLTFPESSFSV